MCIQTGRDLYALTKVEMHLIRHVKRRVVFLDDPRQSFPRNQYIQISGIPELSGSERSATHQQCTAITTLQWK
jgi:hypothetical protein